MLSLEAAGIRPAFKKNRRLVLTEAPGCTLVEFFLTHPSFLVRRVTSKRLLSLRYILLFSQHICIVGCFFFALYFINCHRSFCESFSYTG